MPLDTSKSVAENREQLRAAEDTVFVNAAAYIALATGHEQLERCDEPAANLVGLRTDAGKRIFALMEEVHTAV